MSKKRLEVLCLLLCACLVLISCKPKSGNGGGGIDDGFDNENKTPSGTITAPVKGDVEGGIHLYDISDTEKNIILNGVTDYKILTPAAPDSFEATAAAELVSLIFEATGVSLQRAASELPDGKYISLGQTDLLTRSGLSVSYDELGSQGFKIKTVGDNLIISGAQGRGTLYGVYEFLARELNFDHFFTDTYSLDKGVTRLKLRDYNVTDIPDISYRIPSYGLSNDTQNLNRYRLMQASSLIMPVGGNQWHNSFNYLPPATHKAAHPKWYSDDGHQLCYTAHGDEAELALMLETLGGVMKNTFIAYPEQTVITITIEDARTFCTCPTCSAEREKYGADSAVVVKFCNKASLAMKEWMNSPAGEPYKRDFRILFFAYEMTSAAPVVYDSATDTYSAVDESVMLDPNVCPFVAPINGDYTQDFYENNNATMARDMRGWHALSNEFYLWMYDTNFVNYLLPYNTLGAVQNTYKFAFECGADYIYAQGQWNQPNSATGWSILKQYINSKLGWNVNADVDALTDKFFEGCYGAAEGEMKKLYNEYRVLAQRQCDELGYSGARSIYFNGVRAELWPKSTLINWLNRLDAAAAALPKATDTAEYDRRVTAIETEKISYLYLALSLYQNTLSGEALSAYKADFKRIVDKAGLMQYAETASATIQALYDAWGIL